MVAIPSPLALLRKIFRPAGGKQEKQADKEGSIGLYGLSRVGKTVFLSVLFREAGRDLQSGRFRLKTRHQETLREMVRTRELLEGKSELKRPAFPPPTQVSRLFHFDAIVNKRRLFPFRTMDYKGEGLDWTRTSGSTETIEFLSSCQCLLFLYEPDEQMLDPSDAEVDVVEPERMRRIELFTSMIANLRKDRKVKLDMPIGLIITKADLLEGFQSLPEEHSVLLNRQLINKKFTDPKDFIDKVLRQPHIQENGPWRRQVKRILTALTLFWDDVLDAAPGFQVFFVSSTGGTKTIETENGQREVVPPPNFRPKGVLAPFYWVVDMLETRQRVRSLHRFAVRWILIPTALLQLVIGGFHIWMRYFDLPEKIGGLKRSTSGESIILEKDIRYRLFLPGIHRRLLNVQYARSAGLYLTELERRCKLPMDLKPVEETSTKDLTKYKQWPSRELRERVESASQRLRRETPSIANRIDEALAVVNGALLRSIEKTIERSGSLPAWQEDPEGKVKQFYEHFAPYPATSDFAVDLFKGIDKQTREKRIRSSFAQVQRLTRSGNLSDRARLETELAMLQTQLAQPTTAISPESQAWVNDVAALLRRVDTMSRAEAEEHESDFPLLLAIVPEGGQGSDAAGGGEGDMEFEALKESLSDWESDKVLYYTQGLQAANEYLRKTPDPTDAQALKHHRAVKKWVDKVKAWQSEGVRVAVKVTDGGGFPCVYEKRGGQYLGPHRIGQEPASDLEVLWILSSPPAGDSNGVRLYFSPGCDTPQPGNLGNREVVLGLKELLGGQKARVGNRGTEVAVELAGSDALPVFGQ